VGFQWVRRERNLDVQLKMADQACVIMKPDISLADTVEALVTSRKEVNLVPCPRCGCELRGIENRAINAIGKGGKIESSVVCQNPDAYEEVTRIRDWTTRNIFHKAFDAFMSRTLIIPECGEIVPVYNMPKIAVSTAEARTVRLRLEAARK